MESLQRHGLKAGRQIVTGMFLAYALSVQCPLAGLQGSNSGNVTGHNGVARGAAAVDAAGLAAKSRSLSVMASVAYGGPPPAKTATPAKLEYAAIISGKYE